jgi:hypothetical protein
MLSAAPPRLQYLAASRAQTVREIEHHNGAAELLGAPSGSGSSAPPLMGNRFPSPVGGAIPPCRGAQAVTAGAHQLSLPLRNGWNIVAMDRLLIAIGEQDERYGSERYDDQRSEGGAKIGFPVVGCLVVRHRDLRLSALIANACTGSRFLRVWQRGAIQPCRGRKRRRRAAVRRVR